jgi:hypothetical protein
MRIKHVSILSQVGFALLQLDLSPFAPGRSRLRVPQEMGVGLAGAKGLQPHPSTFERSTAKGDVSTRALAGSLGRRQSRARHSRRAGSGHPVVDAHSGLFGSCAGIRVIRGSRFHRLFHVRSTGGSEVNATGGRWRPSAPPTERQACLGGADISIATNDRASAAR